MPKSPPPLAKTASAEDPVEAAVRGLPADQMPRLIESYLLASDIERNSPRTLEVKRDILSRLLWHVRRQECATVGTEELRAFFHYLNHAHEKPEGRWDNARMVRPLSAGTVANYHKWIKAFFAWLVEEGQTSDTPLRRIPPPINRPDQIVPFTDAQVLGLLAAAKQGRHPKRDTAILLFMLDTGIRATELCELCGRNLDIRAGTASIRGKGDKLRILRFEGDTRKALFDYFAVAGTSDTAPVFRSDRSTDPEKTKGQKRSEVPLPTKQDPLTRDSLRLLYYRLGSVAGVRGVRCSPHTMRHTFAISFLRAGGDLNTLQRLMGHSTISQTLRYVAWAQADMAKQHAQFSPVARLRGKSR